MAAVPKQKTSRSRRNSRRANSFRLGIPGLVSCPQCHSPMRSHRICPECGYYKGKERVEIEN